MSRNEKTATRSLWWERDREQVGREYSAYGDFAARRQRDIDEQRLGRGDECSVDQPDQPSELEQLRREVQRLKQQLGKEQD